MYDADVEYSEENEEDHEGSCPICKYSIYEGFCEHVISTWSFHDGGTGEWAGNSNALKSLRDSCENLVEVIHALFNDTEQDAFCQIFHSCNWYNTKKPFSSLVEKAKVTIRKKFRQPQWGFLLKLVSLPRRLVIPLAESIKEGSFDTGSWNDFVSSLIFGWPGFVDSSSCEAGGGGMCSDWTTYWGHDAAECGRCVDLQIAAHIVLLDYLSRLASSLK